MDNFEKNYERTVDKAVNAVEKASGAANRLQIPADILGFLSREAADYALAGRIPQAIGDGRLEARAGLSLDAALAHVMLCGNPAMVADATAALAARGFRKHKRKEPGQISMETYW